MSVFCCCRAPPLDDDSDVEDVGQLPHQTIIPLPTLPPPARLADNCHIADCLAPIRRLETDTSRRSGFGVSPIVSSLPPRGRIYLSQLVVEESDAEGDAEGDFDSPVARRIGGPLEAVRSKFSRNRLHGSSARSSRTSVGTSDEELARRAELKRLMHKRIQEELASEDVLPNERCASSASAAKPGSPAVGGGPRDTLEFSMVDTSLPDDVRPDKHGNPKALKTLIAVSPNSDKAAQTKHPSLSSSLHEDRVLALPAEYTDLLSRINIPEAPATPVLQPTQQPSDPQNLSPSSLRLSVATSYGRHASAETPEESLTRKATSSRLRRESSSAFSSWLLVQGLCSSGGSTRKHSKRREVKEQMEAGQTPEVKQEQCHVLDLDLPGIALFEKQSHPALDSFECGATSGAVLISHDTESIGNQASSAYPSAATTRRHTPRTSEVNSQTDVSHTKSLHGLQLSTFGGITQAPPTSREGAAPSRGNVSNQALTIPMFDKAPHAAVDAPSSIAVSETSSYHRREAELEAVEKRFADIVARSLPREPKTSKFKEEFDLPAHPGIVSRSSMLLQKLHLPVPNFSHPRSRSSGPPTTLIYCVDHSRAQAEAKGVGGVHAR